MNKEENKVFIRFASSKHYTINKTADCIIGQIKENGGWRKCRGGGGGENFVTHTHTDTDTVKNENIKYPQPVLKASQDL